MEPSLALLLLAVGLAFALVAALLLRRRRRERRRRRYRTPQDDRPIKL